MSEKQASRTALATAYLRAAHQVLDAEPRILDDPVALRLLGDVAVTRIHDTEARFRSVGARTLRAHLVLRSRLAEDRLAAAVGRGVRQYVILGAGFDTFAWRQPAWAGSLRILEVDRSGTQDAKRAHLAAARMAVPDNLAFATLDFEHESLLDILARHGFDAGTPTFFSWLGVTMYLHEAAIDATLRAMAAFPAGSEVVLTYKRPLHPDDEDAEAQAHLAERVAASGEPFVSYFEPEAMAARLRAAGFATVELLSGAEAGERYFQSRPADLPVPRHTRLACAVR